MSSSLRYYGGKTRLMPQLLPLIPNHTLYISLFGGGGGDIRHKPRSQHEVYNDLNTNMANLFRVLTNPAQRDRLLALVSLLPVSRVLFADFLKICKQGDPDPVRVAAATYYCLTWSYAGIDPFIASDNYFVTSSQKPVPLRWKLAHQHLLRIAERFRGVLIENRPWQEIVDKFDSPNALMYCDPPYEPSTRVSPNTYKHEMTAGQHEELLKRLNTVKAFVMLSGYDCELYRKYLKSWRRVDIPVICTASQRVPKRIEVVWMNYDQNDRKLNGGEQ